MTPVEVHVVTGLNGAELVCTCSIGEDHDLRDESLGKFVEKLVAGSLPEPFQPRRGDAVATWLKAGRDQYPSGSHHYMAMDLLLEDYRLHADTGTPLDQHACEPGCHCDYPGGSR